jgi:pyridoxine 4-dehydrogenase
MRREADSTLTKALRIVNQRRYYCCEKPTRWFPLAAGKLSGPDSPVGRVAKRLNATASQVALAWLLKRSPVMLPIPGTSKVEHLEENLRAAELELDSEELSDLAKTASAG